jgi:hypothetical protein
METMVARTRVALIAMQRRILARIRSANPDSCYGLEPEELTCQSRWEIRHEKNGSCVHVWGDDAECDVWLDYLDLQDPPDCGGWSSRELGLREAFELDLENPSDGLDLKAAIARIQPELLRHLRQLLAEVSVLTAPSLFLIQTSDVVDAVRSAFQFGTRLEYAGVIEDAEREIINALGGSDWAFRDNAPIRLNECAAKNKRGWDEGRA